MLLNKRMEVLMLTRFAVARNHELQRSDDAGDCTHRRDCSTKAAIDTSLSPALFATSSSIFAREAVSTSIRASS
jgi:hypothetical protein